MHARRAVGALHFFETLLGILRRTLTFDRARAVNCRTFVAIDGLAVSGL